MRRETLRPLYAWTLALAAIASTALFASSFLRSSAEAQDAQPAQTLRWDYRAVSLTRELLGPTEAVPERDSRTEFVQIEKALDELGAEGWELVQGDGDLFLFKRPNGFVLRAPTTRTR